jgi:hypothetical protein
MLCEFNILLAEGKHIRLIKVAAPKADFSKFSRSSIVFVTIKPTDLNESISYFFTASF